MAGKNDLGGIPWKLLKLCAKLDASPGSQVGAADANHHQVSDVACIPSATFLISGN